MAHATRLPESLNRAEQMRAALVAFISRAAGAPAHVANLHLLAGGSSQEAWSLDVVCGGGAWAGKHELVLRRGLGGAINPLALSRADEFRVYQVMYEAGVAVPRPFWLADGEERILGSDAFLMQRIEGEAIGRRLVREPAFSQARVALPAQMAAQLARIHAVPPAALPFLPAPAPSLGPALAAVERLDAQLRGIAEPHPALELGLRWLRRHAPQRDRLAVVHGDYRIGNILSGPDGLRAVLDWEFAHLGDPIEDIGWTCVRAWRFGQDHLHFGGIGALEPFLDAYAAAGGEHVDPKQVFYWEVLGNLGWAIGALAQARRHLRGEERSVELASLGRICAEMELELLNLIELA
jgi:aminoglycoside phosphotransferase (APT) family kinase protein